MIVSYASHALRVAGCGLRLVWLGSLASFASCVLYATAGKHPKIKVTQGGNTPLHRDREQ
jgi:hypothetical protein